MEHKKVTPLFFFLSIGTVVSLIASVTAFLNLTFETLNHALPDILTDSYTYGYANYSYDGVRSALALLLIIFPVFMILEHFWSKASRNSELSTWDATLRRWAIYLILFLASITVITDLVILVRYFVSGEITTRFIVKVALTLLVAGKVGYYYIRTLRGVVSPLWKKIYTIGSIALVLAAIIWSFTVMGSPANQRKLRIDQRRIEDLQSIQYSVINFWQQKGKLPLTLAELSNPLSGSIIPKDPEFEKGATYEYKKTTDMPAQAGKSFELCATFTLPMPKGWVPNAQGGVIYPMAARDVAVSNVAPYPGGTGDNWDHDVGRTCFTRTIDPDLYPPYPKPLKQ